MGGSSSTFWSSLVVCHSDMVQHFQVKLGGDWKDYGPEEDKILKRAYMSGFPNAKFELRGQRYEYNFKSGVQKNLNSGKIREIRPPHKWQAPSAPVVPPGKTATVKVKRGQPGTQLTLKHPDGGFYTVSVPRNAKVGQTMLVPIPPHGSAGGHGSGSHGGHGHSGGHGSSGHDDDDHHKKKGWSTGAKVAAGVAGVAVVGTAAVAGVIIAEEGLDGAEALAESALDEVGDGLVEAGDAIGEFGSEAVDFLGEAADSTADFFMDLF